MQIAEPPSCATWPPVKAEGRIVFTGCTRGLGEAMVKFFAAEGALVAGCGRSRKAILALSDTLSTISPL
jgi:NAD(P)-dependent dehydrogenase (short-subunit alcohol dehydrogenase family)